MLREIFMEVSSRGLLLTIVAGVVEHESIFALLASLRRANAPQLKLSWEVQALQRDAVIHDNTMPYSMCDVTPSLGQ